jgi:hypothetical protein
MSHQKGSELADLKLVVVIPAGPRDTPVDTLESVFRYADPELVVVIDDTKGNGINFSHENVIILPSVAHDIFGGLYLNLAMAYRYVVEHVQFDMLLRLDTDALLLGDGLAQAAMSRFEDNPKVGALGAYRLGPDGRKRDWKPARKALDAEMGIRGLRHPAGRRTLRTLVASAPGYIRGEHALAAAVVYRGQAITEMYSRGLLDLEGLTSSRLGDDHIFGLLTVAAGYCTDDFGGPEGPMAVQWKGLPSAPEDLLKAGKLVTHSVRSWGEMSEQEIRDHFAKARG